MLGKRSKPLIGKLSSGVVNRAMEGGSSPRSPLEMKTPSPRGLKCYYDVGGVGLGIVAALENSDNSGCENQANKPLYNRNLSRSRPISVNPVSNCLQIRGEVEAESLEEEYTLVTCRGPGNKCYTRVYCDGGKKEKRDVYKTLFERTSMKTNHSVVYDFSAYPTSDFLSSCHLCQKKLYGRDIYMYRGEKAFCSPECRYSQIVMDERREKCGSEASRSLELSTSPYTSDQIFSTGILAI